MRNFAAVLLTAITSKFGVFMGGASVANAEQ